MRGNRSKSVTPVNAHSPMEPLPEKVLLRDLLAGTCSKEALRLCRTEDLEHLLFKIIGMQGAALSQTDSKPSWWLDDVLPFTDLPTVRSRVHNVVHKWHNTLTTVLESCVQYYRKTTTLRPALGTPGTSSSASPPRKRLKLTINELDLTRTPVVRLKDVLCARYPVLDKGDFMNFLKLQPSGLVPAIAERPVRNLRSKYSPKIPFSSVYGKTVLQDRRYACSKENYERKRDWTNKYLHNHEIQSKSLQYNVTYKPKRGTHNAERRYTFPQRQYRQRRNAQNAFERAFVKPVSVKLKRLNIQPYLLKMNMCRRVNVNIDKTETDLAIRALMLPPSTI